MEQKFREYDKSLTHALGSIKDPVSHVRFASADVCTFCCSDKYLPAATKLWPR